MRVVFDRIDWICAGAVCVVGVGFKATTSASVLDTPSFVLYNLGGLRPS